MALRALLLLALLVPLAAASGDPEEKLPGVQDLSESGGRQRPRRGCRSVP